MAESKRPAKGAGHTSGTSFPGDFPKRRELIVVAKPEAGLRATTSGVTSVAGMNVSQLDGLLAAEGVRLMPLFGDSEDQVKARAASFTPAAGILPDLSVYYHVEAPDDRLDSLAAAFRGHAAVEAAYVKPPAEPAAAAPLQLQQLNFMLPREEGAPAVTPDFTASQGYLDVAPGGIDARYAWTVPGGGGAGVNIIDCEWAWNTTHEDLVANEGAVVVGAAAGDDNHGTAVQGEMGGNRNGFGVTGICPDAFRRFAAFSLPTATVIHNAANFLNPGDLLLLVIHRAGPKATGVGQQGYIAVEWWPDDFDAILYASSRGVVVVEAAGNGAQNLDDPAYNTPSAGFPASWKNPFNRANRDSGAILVGAGAPPPGTHGANWGPDRSRLDFSNYGASIDAQGWGREVTTSGYGDLQGGANHNVWYTTSFSGTSSASPIVTGALACVQGALRNAGRIPLSPARARDLLRTTGSPQQASPASPLTQRIGNRPNLRQLIPAALQTSTFAGTQFTGTLQANQTARWFTFNWPAHWHVVWTVVPDAPNATVPQVKWKVQVERASLGFITYWINVTNVTATPVTFEARYNVLGW
ncbi:MAG: S8 family peptidase [Acidobacteriota bacterium]